jgi:antitoxin (DNA-binding transcriptional repressor) of toxin-antitoxin stability system
MKEIAAATFEKQCLSLLDELDPDGIVIIKGGKPVAKLVPVGSNSAPAVESLDDKNKIRGKGASTGVEWGC